MVLISMYSSIDLTVHRKRKIGKLISVGCLGIVLIIIFFFFSVTLLAGHILSDLFGDLTLP